jgi:hypothetical protein
MKTEFLVSESSGRADGLAFENWTLVVEPVMLTMDNDTMLLFEAWRDPSGTGHTIYARLVDASGSGLSGYTVTLTVNGTAYTQQTNSTGCVTLHLALQPGDTSANTYQVVASFNGTNPRSANETASARIDVWKRVLAV